MAELVFVGVPAFVGRIDGQHRCAFWSEDRARCTYGPERLVEVDLAKNTRALAPERWDEVEIDAHYLDGGLTTIGRSFNGGMYVGAAYLSGKLFAQRRPAMDWPPHPGELDYQYTSIARADAAGEVRRWFGFKAEVQGISGPLVKVRIYETGDSVGKGPYWIDPTDPELCDPVYSRISAESPVGTRDALFLTWKYASLLAISVPKLPAGAGEVEFPGVGLAAARPRDRDDLAALLTERANGRGH